MRVFVDARWAVREGAVSSAINPALVYVDYRIPEVSLLPDGWLCRNWRYLAVHELAERAAMIAAGYWPGMPAAEARRIYLPAHELAATPAERRAVEADGGDWRRYEAHVDGLLSHVERDWPRRLAPPLPLITARTALGEVHARGSR